jgi:exopolysaccharide biosynthesis polyprenyl glycosylphosphotransferase
MTPTPGISHVDVTPATLGVKRRKSSVAATAFVARLLDPHAGAGPRLAIDLVVLWSAAALALFADSSIRSHWLDRALVLVFPPLVLAIIGLRRSVEDRLKGSLIDLLAQLLGSLSLAAMLIVAAESLFSAPHPLALALRLWLFSVVYLGTERSVLFSLRRSALRSDAFSTPTLIVGAGVVGSQVVMRLAAERDYGLRPVGFLDADPMPLGSHLGSPSVPVLGGPDDLLSALETTGARHVILAFSSEPDHVLVAKVRACQALGVEVSLVPRFYEAINERTSLGHVGGLPLLTLHPVDPRGWQFTIKHAIDRGSAALAVLVLAPLMALIAIAVRLSSPGPALFRQRRIGRDGHEFDLLKFRTMRVEDERGEFALEPGLAPGGVEGTDRRTRIGRFLRDLSIDELPQLINVARGDMSLVGPRPERPQFAALFARDVARYEDRHRVKSGITGWAQVHGLRGQTSIADRVEWDNYYIANWSLRLDIKIMLLTVAELLRFRDSHAARHRAKDATRPDLH